MTNNNDDIVKRRYSLSTTSVALISIVTSFALYHVVSFGLMQQKQGIEYIQQNDKTQQKAKNATTTTTITSSSAITKEDAHWIWAKDNKEGDQSMKQDQQQERFSSVDKTTTTDSQRIVPPPDYILGLSTGHAGSTTYDAVLRQNSNACPWSIKGIAGKFETTPKGERTQRDDPSSRCNYTKSVLIPFLDRKRRYSRTWIDLGHYHNSLPSGLECLAETLGNRLAFVRIRRNRYDIANSFSKEMQTSCIRSTTLKHPSVSYCPHSSEVQIGGLGPTTMPVNDKAWDSLTAFQQFLWVADEIEMRSHIIKQNYPQVRYYETTWTTSEELGSGMNEVKRLMGCNMPSSPNGKGKIPNKKKHIKHKDETRNCTRFILQDLDYRNKIGMTEDQISILLLAHRQRIGGSQCNETQHDLQQVLLNAGEQIENWEFQEDLDDLEQKG